MTETLGIIAGNSAWMLISASLVWLMTPALALFYGGLSRQKSVLNMIMMSIGSLAVVSIIWVLWGWSASYGGTSIAGIVGNPFEQFALRGAIYEPGTGGEFAPTDGSAYATLIDVGFQLTFAVISTAIISGALAERVKFGAWLLYAGIWVSLVYIPLAHMVWNGGLLSHAENSIASWMFGTTSDGEGGLVAAVAPIDFAGGTVVHISAGTTALVLAYIIGKRQVFPKATRPHNLPLVVLGGSLLWFGWFGFNAGSAFAADGLAALAWINTVVAPAAAGLGWMLVEKLRDGQATTLGLISGAVAGLVAITPAAGNVDPWAAIILGATGGALCAYGVGLKYKLGFDDSLDAVGIHLIGGLWGTVALAFFANSGGIFTGGDVNGWAQLAVQIVIALVAMVFSAVIAALIGLVVKVTIGWRVSDEDEHMGIDRQIHGETAYEQASGLLA